MGGVVTNKNSVGVESKKKDKFDIAGRKISEPIQIPNSVGKYNIKHTED